MLKSNDLFCTIPNEIVYHICTYLPVKPLVQLAQSSSFFKSFIFNQSVLAEKIYQAVFSQRLNSIKLDTLIKAYCTSTNKTIFGTDITTLISQKVHLDPGSIIDLDATHRKELEDIIKNNKLKPVKKIHKQAEEQLNQVTKELVNILIRFFKKGTYDSQVRFTLNNKKYYIKKNILLSLKDLEYNKKMNLLNKSLCDFKKIDPKAFFHKFPIKYKYNKKELNITSYNFIHNIFKALLEKPKKNVAKDYAFMLCIMRLPQLVPLLLELGASIRSKFNLFGFEAITLAIISKQSELVPMLLARGASRNQLDCQGLSPIFYAVKHRDHLSFDYLIQAGAKRSIINHRGETPLLLSISKKDKYFFNNLYNAKIDLDYLKKDRTKFGSTALHYLAYGNSTDIASQLLPELKENLIVQDKNGNTPLLLAIKNKYMPLASLFLQTEPRCSNICNKRGETPLYLSVTNNLPNFSQSLVEFGANIHHQGPEGLTPVALAKDINMKKILTSTRPRGC